MLPLILLIVLSLFSCPSGFVEPASLSEDDYASLREHMVPSQLESRDITNRQVLEAMRMIPRHLFVPEVVRHYAYLDRPVQIGERQTISQPYVVALMTQTAAPRSGDRALEIGTGSGYQAAILGVLVEEVYTIEILTVLAQGAEKVLSELGFENVTVRLGDGYRGWPEKAPFDIILVTAAAPLVPQPLIDQLAEGGRLVMPVGEIKGIQTLTLLTKKAGRVEKERVTGVRFVPMTGEVQRHR